MDKWKLYGWDPSVPRYREFYYDTFERVKDQDHNWGYDYFYKENYHFDSSPTGSIYEMFDTRIKTGDIVLDLGANVGFFARRAAERGATVIAVEGSKECFSCLVENTHDLPNIHPIHAIVVGSEITSNVWSSNSEHSPVITISEIMNTYNLSSINFLKCDIEGGEYDLIANTPLNVWDSIDTISMEGHGDEASSIQIPNKSRNEYVSNGGYSFYFR